MKEIKTKNCLFKSFNIKNKNKTKKKPAQQKFIKPKKTQKTTSTRKKQQQTKSNKLKQRKKMKSKV